MSPEILDRWEALLEDISQAEVAMATAETERDSQRASRAWDQICVARRELISLLGIERA